NSPARSSSSSGRSASISNTIRKRYTLYSAIGEASLTALSSCACLSVSKTPSSRLSPFMSTMGIHGSCKTLKLARIFLPLFKNRSQFIVYYHTPAVAEHAAKSPRFVGAGYIYLQSAQYAAAVQTFARRHLPEQFQPYGY